MLKNMFKTKYRVVTDKYSGFEAQYKVWWFPFWVQCYGTNTSFSVNDAIKTIERHAKPRFKSKVVAYHFPPTHESK